MHETDGPEGVEPGEVSVKNLQKKITMTLEVFHSNLSDKTQVEKSLVLRSILRRVNYFKKKLEVVVSLEDRSGFPGAGLEACGANKLAARLSAKSPTPSPPSCNTEFDKFNGVPGRS